MIFQDQQHRLRLNFIVNGIINTFDIIIHFLIKQKVQRRNSVLIRFNIIRLNEFTIRSGLSTIVGKAKRTTIEYHYFYLLTSGVDDFVGVGEFFL